MTFEIPLPPAGLSPNARLHWAALSRFKAAYKAVVTAKARVEKRKQGWEPDGVLVIDYDWFMAKRMNGDGLCRPRDLDNAIATMKVVQDALVDAGVCPADSAKHVRLGTVTLRRNRKEHGGRQGIVITVRKAD